MRQDEQISAVLSLKKFFILNGEWVIQCDDENIKKFIEDALYLYTEDRFESYLYNILSCLDYGFSLSEKIWARVNVPSYGQKIVLQSLKTRAPHSFEIHTDSFGNISEIRQDQGGRWITIPYDKFIHYTYMEEFDNPYGQSELNLGIYRAWWSKNALIKMWNIALERFGNPPVVGKYPQSLVKEKDNLKSALSNIQTKTAIVIPEEIEVELLKGDPKNDAFKQAIDFYNTVIARKMLIPDLMGISGSETSGGSYALGQAQFDMFYNNIGQERKKLERVINRDIIQPLVLWNFGSGKDVKFVFQTVDYKERREDLKVFLQAVSTGQIPVMFEHVNWFLKSINAPEVEKADFDKMEEEKKAMAEQIRGGLGEKDGEKLGEEKPKEKGEEKPVAKEKKPAETKKEEFTVREYENKYDSQVNYEYIENTLDSIEKTFIGDLSKVMRLSINSLIDDIQRKKIIEGKRYDALNKLSFSNMPMIKKVYSDNMLTAAQFGKTSAKQEMQYDIDESAAQLGSEDAARLFEEYVDFFATDDASEILRRSKSVLLNSIRSGMGVKETIGALREALVDYTGDTSSTRLERLVRTATSRAYNEGRALSFHESIEAGRIIGFEFSAVMDSRTSDVCAALNGKVYKPDSLSMVNPPLHFNCRSILVAIHDDEQVNEYNELPKFDVDEWGFLRLSKEQTSGNS
jgi:SPP1 gp7 family putative phage head morphogenesis protein